MLHLDEYYHLFSLWQMTNDKWIYFNLYTCTVILHIIFTHTYILWNKWHTSWGIWIATISCLPPDFQCIYIYYKKNKKKQVILCVFEGNERRNWTIQWSYILKIILINVNIASNCRRTKTGEVHLDEDMYYLQFIIFQCG